jgi:trehalose 2-sulfotransferase
VPVSPSSYFICATPRSGSTLLCGLLRSTGIAGRPQSYFRAPDEQRWADRWQIARDSDGTLDYREYVESAMREGRSENGVFGARVMWGTMDEIVVNLTTVYPELAPAVIELLNRAFGPLRFVYLSRRDDVAQAVSWARAEQTGFWQDGDIHAGEPHFDRRQIAGLIATINDHNAAWRRWFRSLAIRPLVVTYEDLVADMVGVTRSILDFLGLPLSDDRMIAPHHHRQADALNDQWITRYRAGPPAVSPHD